MIECIIQIIMVFICNQPYPNESNERYSEYFEWFPYVLSDFQKYSIQAIVEGQHSLITAHTGSGKSLPAEFALQYFHKKGKKTIYTSPIKALSNQKYYEFTQKYPEISFGLITGDIKLNPTADVLIMTAEILLNALFQTPPRILLRSEASLTEAAEAKLPLELGWDQTPPRFLLINEASLTVAKLPLELGWDQYLTEIRQRILYVFLLWMNVLSVNSFLKNFVF